MSIAAFTFRAGYLAALRRATREIAWYTFNGYTPPGSSDIIWRLSREADGLETRLAAVIWA